MSTPEGWVDPAKRAVREYEDTDDLVKLNLACGSVPEAGWINVDKYPMPGVDVAHDLDSYPWPWADDSIDLILAFDIFEHVDKPCEFMVECWRILQPGGLLRIHTCHIGNPVNAFRDPTHKRFLMHDSFEYWIPGTFWHDKYGLAYSLGNPKVGFEQLLKEQDPDLHLILRKI